MGKIKTTEEMEAAHMGKIKTTEEIAQDPEKFKDRYWVEVKDILELIRKW